MNAIFVLSRRVRVLICKIVHNIHFDCILIAGPTNNENVPPPMHVYGFAPFLLMRDQSCINSNSGTYELI